MSIPLQIMMNRTGKLIQCIQRMDRGCLGTNFFTWVQNYKESGIFLTLKQNVCLDLFPTNTLLMIKNYLVVAWRNLLHNRTTSLIILTGLSISVAFCTLLFFHIRYEQSFDRWHRNGNRLYRLEMDDPWGGGSESQTHDLEFPLVTG